MNDIKKLQRTVGIEARNSLGIEYRSTASDLIVKNILKLPEFENAKTVMLYRAIKAEADIFGLTLNQKKYCYPICCADNKLKVYHPFSEKSWVKGKYGITEPDPESSELIEPDDIDLVICPSTAFDGKLNRCGMGGGYYDRFLPKCKNAVIAAAAFEVQRQDELYTEPTDMKMDIIITENNIYRR